MAAELEATTSVGSLLNGTYLLERVIAEGGMGVVYEAQHLRLPRKFAIKVLGKPKDAGLASNALQRFQREAEIAATLQHPHIVETFDFQVSERGSPYLVMELLEGEDLNDRLKRAGRLSIPGALRVIEEMAVALDEAHEKGVVHRDLKPANVFLCKKGDRLDFVKVLDFGVSKLIDAETLTQEKAMVGTPLYMSPEQAVGVQELTPESDVFSFGAIAFELLTGRRAFAASSIPSILYQIVHGPTPQPSGKAPGLTEHVDAVFAKVLAKKKKDRFARSTHFAAALRAALMRPVDADFDKALPDLMDLATSEERGSGLIRGHITGGPTEIDNSTRAEEAMEVAAGPPSPDPELAEDSLPGEASFSAQMEALRGRRRTGLWAMLGLAALAIGGGVAYVSRGPAAPHAAPVVVSAPPPSPRRPMQPVVTPLPPPQEPAMDFNPDAIDKHENVQWIFQLVPRTAQVTVDDKRVLNNKLTLPWQTQPRRVRVAAPGYQTIIMSVRPTTSQTFALQLTRGSSRAVSSTVRKTVSPAPTRVHESAPVQEL